MIRDYRISAFVLRSISTILLALLYSTISAQVKPAIKFQKDSVLIGEPTPVSFSYTHSPGQEILFPDSTFDFSPFEYEYREVYTTITDSLSKDSCVYYLSTFELDKIQILRLPVFVFTKKDSIPVYSAYDSITLTEVIPVVSDTLQIKENTDLQEVETDFNALLFSIISGISIILLLVLGFIFRKRIMKYFQIRKLKKLHQKFLIDFDDAIGRYTEQNDVHSLEKIVHIWKLYSERISGQPFTKLSTKEIQQFIKSENILSLLKQIDGELYGGIKQNEYEFRLLRDHAISGYTKRLEELHND